jgi:hypothetical protein
LFLCQHITNNHIPILGQQIFIVLCQHGCV